MLLNDFLMLNMISNFIKGRSIFPYRFLNSNNVKIRVGGWIRKKVLLELKSEKNLYAQKKKIFDVNNEEREWKISIPFKKV